MSNPEQSYNLRQIRKLLNLFDDSDLEAWCLGDFPNVFDKFGRGMNKQEKITLLLAYCRRDPIRRFELLLEIVRSEDKEAFKRFEPSLRGNSLGGVKVTELKRLFFELREWKLIHHDVQNLLDEIDQSLKFLTWYKFKKDPDWLEKGLLAWNKLQLSKLKNLPDRWQIQYIDHPSFSYLNEYPILISLLVEKLINEISDVDFKKVYLKYSECREICSSILQTADQNIKILIEEIVTQIGV